MFQQMTLVSSVNIHMHIHLAQVFEFSINFSFFHILSLMRMNEMHKMYYCSKFIRLNKQQTQRVSDISIRE